MADESHLDFQYFVDLRYFNCPFCKRNHLPFTTVGLLKFHYSDEDVREAFVVECVGCEKRSLHLAKGVYALPHGKSLYLARHDEKVPLDELIFASIPSSRFVLDESIPRVLRDLLTQADGCRKMGHLTGASACVRKLIYELTRDQGGDGKDYEESIKSLKQKLPRVPEFLFDTLVSIKVISDDKLHEDSAESWSGRQLNFILEALKEVLFEIYVKPAREKERHERILAMRRGVEGKKKVVVEPKETDPPEQQERGDA